MGGLGIFLSFQFSSVQEREISTFLVSDLDYLSVCGIAQLFKTAQFL